MRHLEADSVGCANRVTADHVISFIEENTNYSASHQRHIINAVKGFLEYHKNPCLLGCKYRIYGTPETRKEFLTREQMEILLRTPMSWEEALIVFAARLEGLRGTEILRFRAGDAREAMRSKEVPVRGKMRPDTVPLRSQLEALLKGYLETHPKEDEDLMLGFSRSTLSRRLKKLSERVGFPVELRRSRRGFGKDFYEEHAPLVDIAQLMRHKDPAMTVRYLCLDSDSKRKTMEKVIYSERSELPFLLAK
jgi:integrase